uniref:Uncharacterized protein n=1 Tax=Ananas comosus var. bracteatus TaxID=296719 RepID=A0A6V7PGP5_ANACO|nr:unnamed protein product [Ananas comosus var. bracteatus]
MRDGNQRRSAEHERVRGTTVRDLGEGSAAVRRIRTALGERGARLQGPVRARALPPRQAQGRARAPRGGGALCSAARAPRGGGALCGRAPGRRAEAGRSAGARPGAGWRACSSARGARAAGRRAGWRAGSSERGARAGGCRRGRGRSVLRGCFGRAAASSYYPSGASGPVAPRGYEAAASSYYPSGASGPVAPRGYEGAHRGVRFRAAARAGRTKAFAGKIARFGRAAASSYYPSGASGPVAPRGYEGAHRGVRFRAAARAGRKQGICVQIWPFWPSGGFLLLPERSIRPRGTPGVRRCSPRGTFSSGRTGGPKARHLRANLAVLAERRLPPTTRAEHPAPWHPGGTKVLTEGYVFERPHGRAVSKAFAGKIARFGRAAASSYYPSGASAPVAPRGYEGAHRGVRFRAAARAGRNVGTCGQNCRRGAVLAERLAASGGGSPGPRGLRGGTGGPKPRHLLADLPPAGLFWPSGWRRASAAARARVACGAGRAGQNQGICWQIFRRRGCFRRAAGGGSPGPRGLRDGTGGPKRGDLRADLPPAGLFSPSGGRRQAGPSWLAGRDGRAKTKPLAGRFAAGGAVFGERRRQPGPSWASRDLGTCGQFRPRGAVFTERRATSGGGSPGPRAGTESGALVSRFAASGAVLAEQRAAAAG